MSSEERKIGSTRLTASQRRAREQKGYSVLIVHALAAGSRLNENFQRERVRRSLSCSQHSHEAAVTQPSAIAPVAARRLVWPGLRRGQPGAASSDGGQAWSCQHRCNADRQVALLLDVCLLAGL